MGPPTQKAIAMKISLTSDLLEATRLTNAGRLTVATADLQRMLGGQMTPGSTNLQTLVSSIRAIVFDIAGPGLQPDPAMRSADRSGLE